MPQSRQYNSDAFNRLPFREKLDVLYDVSARDRRDLILTAPDAQRLVRSFAPESLFYTLKELGLQDGFELLALASGEQLTALVDIDCWKKDRVDIRGLLEWLEIILEGGTQAVGEFLNAVDLELLILLFKRFIRVYRADDPEEPPEEEGPEVFELDEHYKIVFHHWDARTPLVRSLLEALYERDYSYFVTVMEEVWWGVESDLEEASFRLRNARLQDRGFPDYFDALEIYRPLTAAELPERSRALGRAAVDLDEVLPQDRSLLLPAEDGTSFLSQVLHAGFDAEAAAELRMEMAHLVNRVLVAEGVDYGNRDEVAARVRLAHDIVNLALESLSGSDFRSGVAVVAHRYVQHLFRVGWGLLLELRRAAKRATEALGLTTASDGEVLFLDTPYREALAGLTRMKPSYFQGLDRRGEIGFRAFAGLADVERARALVADVTGLPELCIAVTGQSPAAIATLRPHGADDFRLSAALLTALAQRALDRPVSLQPLGADDLALLRSRTLDTASGGLRAEVRRGWLESTGRHAPGFLELSLTRFEEEFLAVSADRPIDPRYVSCLMIQI